VKSAAGNLSAFDPVFETLLTARIVLLRRLKAPITNPKIAKLAFAIRDKEMKSRFTTSKIQKCQFSTNWVTGYKARNRLSTRKTQSKKKATDAKPEDIDAWIKAYGEEIALRYLCFAVSAELWGLVRMLVLALQGNTDETPLLFENIADYTVDFKGRSRDQDSVDILEIKNSKTQMTMVPTCIASGALLPQLYITTGLTEQTLINVVKEYTKLGSVGKLDSPINFPTEPKHYGLQGAPVRTGGATKKKSDCGYITWHQRQGPPGLEAVCTAVAYCQEAAGPSAHTRYCHVRRSAWAARAGTTTANRRIEAAPQRARQNTGANQQQLTPYYKQPHIQGTGPRGAET
jgi:hypothetical protein